MQGCTECVVSYSELVEDRDGLIRQCGEEVLGAEGHPSRAFVFASPEEAVAAWADWMGGLGYRVEELPWCRRHGLGLVYSAVTGCESRLYAVMVYEDASV